MFIWTEQSIQWYEDATEWTGYHERAARKLSEFALLDRDDVVCDVGCGTGTLSAGLAPFVRRILSVDVDERALQCLRGRIRQRQITNIEVIVSDYTRLPADFCDVVVACSFGVFGKNGSSFLKLAKKRLVMVKRKFLPSQEGFSKDYGRGNLAYMDEAYLNEHSIPYRTESYEDDFGQPFRSREEAVRYVEHYRLNPADESVDAFLERRMSQTGDAVFPYYIPNPMENCILIIEKSDLTE